MGEETQLTIDNEQLTINKRTLRMDNFYQRVYEVVTRIPRGRVATYGQIAAMLGNPQASRAVGWAMQNAPGHLQLPCHRVVNKTGSLAPFYAFGGAEKQRAILESEGIDFLPNGNIDMKKCLWQIC